MKKQIFTLLTLLATCVTGAWADDTTATIDFGDSGYSDLVAISFSDGDNTTGSLVDATLGDSKTKVYSSAYSAKGLSTSFTSKTSYTDISGLSFYVSTSDKGKTNLAVEICPNEDFSSDVTTVQATATMNGGGLPTNVGNNNAYYQESYTISTPVSGYVRITVAENSGSSGKTINVGKIAITYSASGKTTLTGAWSDASLSFNVGSSATIPTFSVNGGGTLGTDYTVAYTKTDESGIVTLTNGTGAISAISTAAAATATVTATVTIVNTTDYEMATTAYNCVITVIAATPYAAPTITEKNGTVQITSSDDGVLVSQIKYSLDGGSSWMDYTIPFNLDKAKTVKAKVLAGSDPSHLESKVTTQACGAIPAAIAGSYSITLYNDDSNWTKTASQEGSSTIDTWTGKIGTDFEGYSIVLDNVGKTGTNIKELSSGSAINGKNTIKGSNGRKLTFTIPTGLKVNRVTIYSYTNGDNDNNYASSWSFDGSAADMIGLSLRDNSKNSGKSVSNVSNASNPDVRVFSFATPLEDSFELNNSGYQQCFYMVLDYTRDDKLNITPAKEYTSFCSEKALDFTSVEGVEAYAVSSVDTEGQKVTLTKVTKVPANAGLILRKTGEATSYEVPTLASADAITNKLVGVTSPTTINNVSGHKHYILSNGSFVEAVAGSTLAAGKAYLDLTDAEAPDLSSSSRGLGIVFGEDTPTAIEGIKTHNVAKGGYFNLAGQRVAQPTKGLYIVNGRKVVVK